MEKLVHLPFQMKARVYIVFENHFILKTFIILGKVYAWGMGSNNQLGIGSEDDQYTPTLLQGKQVLHNNVLKVSSGGQHSLFIVES